MVTAIQERIGNPRTFVERWVALCLVLLAMCGVVSAPVCGQAQAKQKIDAAFQNVAGVTTLSTADAAHASCDDPCCEHSRSVPLPKHGGCEQHCLEAAPIAFQVLDVHYNVAVSVPNMLVLVRLTPVREERAAHVVHEPNPPLSFVVPLRI